MKRLFIAAALALSACAGSLPVPATYANQTVLDENIGRGAEVSYKLARTVIELGVDAGLLKGAKATQAADLDNRLFASLSLVRTAYRAGNANNYLSGAAEVTNIATQINDLIHGAKK